VAGLGGAVHSGTSSDPAPSAPAASVAHWPEFAANDAGAQRAATAASSPKAAAVPNNAAATARAGANATAHAGAADGGANANATVDAGATAGAGAGASEDDRASDDNSGSPSIDAALQTGATAAAGPKSADAPGAPDLQGAAAAPGIANSASATVTNVVSAATPATAVARRAATVLAAGGEADRPALNSTDGSLSLSVAAADTSQSNFNVDTRATPTFSVAAGVDTPEFGQGVAGQVSSMLDGKLTSAVLQVNPPQLGPVEVRIAVQGDHAQVWFVSHSATTRDALESSSTNLRDMLGAQGFGQVSVDVSPRNSEQRPPPGQPYDEGLRANPGAAKDAASPASAARARIPTSALDAYA
jgi:flagellar hook-length control protein FliK